MKPSMARKAADDRVRAYVQGVLLGAALAAALVGVVYLSGCSTAQPRRKARPSYKPPHSLPAVWCQGNPCEESPVAAQK
jgi:hypothetical protein